MSEKGYAKVYSAQTHGLEPHIIDIEIDLLKGIHSFSIVGLAGKAVEEARDRVSAAIKNAGFDSPKKHNRKVVVALAPADLPKAGASFDVGIAVAYLSAIGEEDGIVFNPRGKLFLGELSLDGAIRPTNGVLAHVRHAKNEGFREVYVPKDNASEAALVSDIDVYPAATLQELVEHLDTRYDTALAPQPKTEIAYTPPSHTLDMSDVKGQESAKRALEIAAAGGHNIALYGPPGAGKTMLARAFTSILPRLSFDDVLEVTGIHSISGNLSGDLITHPPYRAPHHTSSYVAMVGGGTYPTPGEVTLAHKGVLFMDEFPEFSRRVIEALRQPLEDRIVQISRAKGSAEFPANFILVAAMNPCPCGNRGSKTRCNCTPSQLKRYERKISGPIMDRIDMWVRVAEVDHDTLTDTQKGEPSSAYRTRVERAREIQGQRFETVSGCQTNSDMGAKELEEFIDLSNKVKERLSSAVRRHNLSARSYHRAIKLARTIADIEESEHIEPGHVMEALQYRVSDDVFSG